MIVKYTSLFLSMILLMVASTMLAQQERPYRKLVTQEVNQRILAERPLTRVSQRTISRYFNNFRQVGQIKPKTIPVIFHIVYRTPQERVSRTQIQSQIDALNRDFNHEVVTINHPAEQLENFINRRPERMDINFCLAEVKVGNRTFDGISYIETEKRRWRHNDTIKSKDHGGSDVFQPNRYLNVWVGHFVDSISGYAQMPGGLDETDGIAIDYRFFGQGGTAVAPYDEGKTLTHLVGNYLGLRELWNDRSPCSDDGIFDTPIHNAPNIGCPTYKHISLCAGTPVEMTMNFMDNTDDACMNMFTFGQMIRMHAALAPRGPRHQLTTGQPRCKDNQDLVDEDIENRSEPEEEQLASNSLPMLMLQPNPAKDEVQILVDEYKGQVELTIYNAMGQLVDQRQFSGKVLTLNCSNWSRGIYLVHAKMGDQRITHRLMITQ